MLVSRMRAMLAFGITVAIIIALRAGCRQSTTTNQLLTIGVWVLNTKGYINRLGGPEELADLMSRHGISYIVPKTHSAYLRGRLIEGWYPDCPEDLFNRVVMASHRRGIKVYAWAYVYGGPTATTDQAMCAQALASSADGLVINAESEYCRDTNRYGDAESLCQAIRTQRDALYPNKLLAYSTFARSWKGIGLRFPYRIFGQYCDQFWPQTYWRTFRQQPEETIQEVDARLRAKYAKWQTEPKWAVGIKPIVHTGHCYANTIPTDELRRFLDMAVKQGHKEVNLYIADRFSDTQWAVIDEFTGGPVTLVGTAPVGFFGWLGATLWWLVTMLLKLYIVVASLRFALNLWATRPGVNGVYYTDRSVWVFGAIKVGLRWPTIIFDAIARWRRP